MATKVIYNGNTQVVNDTLAAEAIFTTYQSLYPELTERGEYDVTTEASTGQRVINITLKTATKA